MPTLMLFTIDCAAFSVFAATLGGAGAIFIGRLRSGCCKMDDARSVRIRVAVDLVGGVDDKEPVGSSRGATTALGWTKMAEGVDTTLGFR